MLDFKFNINSKDFTGAVTKSRHTRYAIKGARIVWVLYVSFVDARITLCIFLRLFIFYTTLL